MLTGLLFYFGKIIETKLSSKKQGKLANSAFVG